MRCLCVRVCVCVRRCWTRSARGRSCRACRLPAWTALLRIIAGWIEPNIHVHMCPVECFCSSTDGSQAYTLEAARLLEVGVEQVEHDDLLVVVTFLLEQLRAHEVFTIVTIQRQQLEVLVLAPLALFTRRYNLPDTRQLDERNLRR